jgi:hypothetical protein
MFKDIDGRIVSKQEVSQHHVFARSLTGGGKLRKFINQTPLVPKMLNEFHHAGLPESLHTNTELLHPPELFVSFILQQTIESLDTTNPYDQLVEFAERVDYMSSKHRNTVVQKDCGRISEGLKKQLPYILRGQVEVIDVCEYPR